MLKKFVNICEVNLRDAKRNERFYNSLVQLVSILFAVVFGVALSELKEVRYWSYDFWVLVLAYVTVILSWWGYHWGIIVGPHETNALNYFIDCLLLVDYWFLMNIRSPLSSVLGWYLAMFFLYWVWEVVRSCKEERPPSSKRIIKQARRVNFTFFILILICFFTYSWSSVTKEQNYIIVLFILVTVYRYFITRVYLPKKQPFSLIPIQKKDLERVLIEEAKKAAANARVHLSGFRVGAAILSDTGKIYVGCNIEFDNYSNTIHAEESAISSFVAAGETKPVSIAIYTLSDMVSFPCGMCRQSLFELGGEDLKVIGCNDKTCEVRTMKELLPKGFHL